MTYTKYLDNPNRREPLSGRDHIQHIEDGLEAAHEAIDDLESSDLEFSDIGGTASPDQIPSLEIAKITGLQDELDAKADADHRHDSDYLYATSRTNPTSMPLKVDQVDVDGHTQLVASIPAEGREGEYGESNAVARADHLHDSRYPTIAAMDTALEGKSDTGHAHVMGDVTGLDAALADKANASHAHDLDDVTGLQDALDGKSDSGHGHAIADVSGLQAALEAITDRLDALESDTE